MSETALKTRHYAARLVWYVYAFVAALLTLRFILKLLGANPGAGFTDLIYTLSYPLALPFLYVFSPSDAGQFIVEWGTLLAILVYWLIAIGIIKLIALSRPISKEEAEEHLRHEDH